MTNIDRAVPRTTETKRRKIDKRNARHCRPGKSHLWNFKSLLTFHPCRFGLFSEHSMVEERQRKDNNKFVVKHEANYLFSNSLRIILLGRIFISSCGRFLYCQCQAMAINGMCWMTNSFVGLEFFSAGTFFGSP